MYVGGWCDTAPGGGWRGGLYVGGGCEPPGGGGWRGAT
jgi:hypothetical protein